MSTFITSLLMPIYMFLGLVNPISVGTSITTINGTDTLSSSRTTINDNFTALNNGKLEQSNYFATTSLPSSILASSLTSVGTITSGTWNGTTIGVSNGGTGSTTLASNQVLLGNGTGNVGVVSGLGTTGQFLTSNGAGSAPTWQTSAIATGDDYTWTGGHMWTASSTHLATTTISASSVTNNALVLNTVPYSFPSSGIASSTTWAFDANGKATYNHTQSFDQGNFSTSTGIGTKVINHGLGAVPKMIKITTMSDTGDPQGGSWGVATSSSATGQSCIFLESLSNAVAAHNGSNHNNIICARDSNNNTEVSTAYISAWDESSFTLTFTANAVVTSYMIWEAYQ